MMKCPSCGQAMVNKMSKAQAQKLDNKLDKKLGEKEQLRDAKMIMAKRKKK